MVEKIREVKIVVTVDTNKATYTETFSDIKLAWEWLMQYNQG